MNMRFFLFKFGELLSFLDIRLFRSVKMYVYSGIKSIQFGKVGENFVLAPSVNQIVQPKSVFIGDQVKIGTNATITVWGGRNYYYR